jgi:hypothetical protein
MRNEGGGGHCMKELVKPKPIDGKIRSLESVNYCASRIKQTAEGNQYKD